MYALNVLCVCDVHVWLKAVHQAVSEVRVLHSVLPLAFLLIPSRDLLEKGSLREEGEHRGVSYISSCCKHMLHIDAYSLPA